MSFIRSFNQAQLDKMMSGENAVLFNRLKADVLKGELFPAVRKNELHFYYKGGCLYKFAGGSFKRDKNFEKFGAGLENLLPYERAKKEVERKFTNARGKEKERQLLDELNCHTFNPLSPSRVVMLDIEVNLNGTVCGGKKCDMVLLNTRTDELMFVEGKVFSDSRVNVSQPNIPEVIAQVDTYSAAIAEQRQIILEQYARHIEVLNSLFGTAYCAPERLIEPAKLLVYETPKTPRKNGEYSIDKINAALGESNVLWVECGNCPTLENIWTSFAEERDIVVFDLETTGINCEEDSIIEIGAVKLRNGKIIDNFHSFVSCPQKLSEKVEKLTGISNQDISGAPCIKEALECFTCFADSCTLASYNLSFDYGFMEHNGKQFERKIDILSLAREKLQGTVNNFKLATVAAYYGITLPHGTVGSAEAAAKVLIHFV